IRDEVFHSSSLESLKSVSGEVAMNRVRHRLSQYAPIGELQLTRRRRQWDDFRQVAPKRLEPRKVKLPGSCPTRDRGPFQRVDVRVRRPREFGDVGGENALTESKQQ